MQNNLHDLELVSVGIPNGCNINYLSKENVKNLTTSTIDSLINMLNEEKDRRLNEKKEKAAMEFHDAWLQLRAIGVTPRYEYNDKNGTHCIPLNADNFYF